MHTVTSEHIGFNRAVSSIMHIDLNSCFATVEQQANPLLRGKPIAVAAYTSPGGCILAASVEAKRFGVKTGMRVREGQELIPALIVLPPDPDKYRFVNEQLFQLFQRYTADVTVKSIDEMVLSFAGAPIVQKYLKNKPGDALHMSVAMRQIGREIKQKIKAEIGDWLTVSVGIAPNRYLAKVASGLHKPDGLDEINHENIQDVLHHVGPVEGLVGIKQGYGSRLRCSGITTALGMYHADIKTLKHAFHAITGYHWWLRLHGWEIDDRVFDRKTFGHSYALRIPYSTTDVRLRQVLYQLVAKMGQRLRTNGYTAQGLHVSCFFTDTTHWNHGETTAQSQCTDQALYTRSCDMLAQAPEKEVRLLAVNCFHLASDVFAQQSLFDTDTKAIERQKAIDAIHARWGSFTIRSGRMLGMEQTVLDRISFGQGRNAGIV